MDIAITPANVIPSSAAAQSGAGKAGATIVAGQTLYKAADGTLKLCDSNGASPIYKFFGISTNSAAPGQLVAYVTLDPALAIGGVHLAGTVLKTSVTPGGMAPIADAIAGEFVTVLGVVNADGTLNLNPSTSTGAIPA
jgi:hypothetical protein